MKRNTCFECTKPDFSRGLCAVCYMRNRRNGTLDKFKRSTKRRAENFEVLQNGCHQWTGHKSSSGYGIIQLCNEPRIRVPAHRYFYEIANGKIPKGMFLCHRCDNRSCINPGHMFIGTPADNSNDAAKKNRMAVGEKHGNSKLTSGQVLAIRKSKKTQRELAEKYCVNQSTIWRIRAGRTRLKEFIEGSNH